MSEVTLSVESIDSDDGCSESEDNGEMRDSETRDVDGRDWIWSVRVDIRCEVKIVERF